jgi:hypothetical protein
MWNQQRVVDLVESELQSYRLILVSNREPYTHQYSAALSTMGELQEGSKELFHHCGKFRESE